MQFGNWQQIISSFFALDDLPNIGLTIVPNQLEDVTTMMRNELLEKLSRIREAFKAHNYGDAPVEKIESILNGEKKEFVNLFFFT
jgi:hypothetical protein